METGEKSYYSNLSKEEKDRIRSAIRTYIRDTLGYDAFAKALGIKVQSVHDRISQLNFSRKAIDKWASVLHCDDTLFYTGNGKAAQYTYLELIAKVQELERRLEALEARMETA